MSGGRGVWGDLCADLELQYLQQKERIMYTLPILYYEWEEGGLGGFMCRFGTMEHILEGMKTYITYYSLKYTDGLLS
jgi:hypothetical protein